ncbi:MAG: hypothetical protein JJ858_14940 [Rhizobiaceae bacterium]|nr:hypothetical protein [Rhizobiaceae bacterium]
MTGKKELNDRILNVVPDVKDLRDRIYEPSLLDLKLSMSPPSPSISPILDQKFEGACTGFALASAINLQNNLRQAQLKSQSIMARLPAKVSPRMLYNLAQMHDEWDGEDYEGSSIRGALKGFFHNGVCDEKLAPYIAGDDNWFLKKEQAKNARLVGLGAYYRLRPEIIDYHSALNETGVIYASAEVYRGWRNPRHGVIKQSSSHEGGHAFIIVGYDENGFLIQNSWGRDWGGYAGHSGIAHWSYADWAENVRDAWVLRLSVPTPEYFDLTHTPRGNSSPSAFGQDKVSAPKRGEINGHYIHLDDGKLKERDRYPSPKDVIKETANVLIKDEMREDENARYQHLMFYFHGGLNGPKDSARRIRAMKPIFKRNGIYPIHFMWETGITEELKDVLFGVFDKSEKRVGSNIDWKDRIIEKFSHFIGTAVWRQMKEGAHRSFKNNAGGTEAMKILLQANLQRKKPLKIHFVGHSAGSILMAELLRAKNQIDKTLSIESVSLMAPACTIDVFKKNFSPLIGQSGGIKVLNQYNLIDQRELDDTVGPYGKSLLYLVSRAFEDEYKTKARDKSMPLLGMEKYKELVDLHNKHTIHYAGRNDRITNSKTHGGFDNDRATMNHILKTILGKKPSPTKGFMEHELKGY